ncbi:hypothetical protein AcV5_010387 [Taiwanofungus camphoratus]|nr:hypothetical protein AcV5_010387 [Antrodia cinnamomea]
MQHTPHCVAVASCFLSSVGRRYRQSRQSSGRTISLKSGAGGASPVLLCSGRGGRATYQARAYCEDVGLRRGRRRERDGLGAARGWARPMQWEKDGRTIACQRAVGEARWKKTQPVWSAREGTD